MRKLEKLTIQVANEPDALGEFACALWAKQVKIRALTAEVLNGKVIIRLEANKPAAARAALAAIIRSATAKGVEP